MDQIVEHPRIETQGRSAPRRRKSRFSGLLFLLVVVALAAGVWYWTQHRAAETPAPARSGRGEQASSVGVASVATADVPITYDGLGTVTALATVTVKTQIAGQLTTIGFQEGQMVKKGDFLAQIDPRPYQVALEQAQGALARDEAALKSAEIDLARYQRLSSQDSIARQTLDTQAALVQQDHGTIQTDKAQIDSATLNLTYCHIVAPVDGRVGLRQVDAGNYVQTSDANGIVVITQLQPISVVFTEPEDRLPAIRQRLAAGATLPVSIYDRSGRQLLSKGRLETIDNQIDTTTGTAKLRALFDNADLALFPNQFVNARLLVDTHKDSTVVPSAAVQLGTPGNFVYRVKADDTVAMTPIEIGEVNGETTAVTKGLTPGDRVVIDGIDRLRDGAKVRIPGETPAGGGGSKAGPKTRGSGDAGAAAAGGETGSSPAGAAASDGAAEAAKKPHRRHKDQDGAPPATGAAAQP